MAGWRHHRTFEMEGARKGLNIAIDNNRLKKKKKQKFVAPKKSLNIFLKKH